MYDSDRNGFLDREEISRFVIDMLTESGMEESEMTPERLQFVFNSFDENSDGMIDQEEMCAFLKAVTGF